MVYNSISYKNILMFQEQGFKTIIDVVKRFPDEKSDFIHGIYRSWMQPYFIYRRKGLYKTQILTVDDSSAFDSFAGRLYWNDSRIGNRESLKPGVISYGQGFHSMTLDRAGNNETATSGILVSATIPAGSEYYTDETGLYISNQIIINGRLKPRSR